MTDGLSFRARLILSFWIVLFLALIVPGWYYYQSLKREIFDEAQARVIHQLNAVQWMIDRESPFDNLTALQAWITETGRQLDLRITYLTPEGDIMADSALPRHRRLSSGDRTTRLEVQVAQKAEVGVAIRFSNNTGREEIYAARRSPQMNVLPTGILRVAVPFQNAQNLVASIRHTFIAIMFLIFLVTSFISSILIRQLAGPIRTMIEAADAIRGGAYRRRFRFSPGQEFFPLEQSINRMAEHIESHIRQVTEQKQQLEAVFNGMQEGVMVLDGAGRITSVNRSMSDLMGQTAQSIGRRPLEAFMSLELQDACDRVLKNPSELEGQPYGLQISLGMSRIYDVNIVPLPDQAVDMGAIVVLHDISELKHLEKVRQDFVANVSHELRTPLTSIKGYTETLLGERLPQPETLASFLGVILKNTNHMVKMVDDLLHLARLESRQKPCRPAPVNVGNALMTAWRECAPFAGVKDIRLEAQPPGGDVIVLAEFDQLVQVFRNLLENGIKYSPAGKAIAAGCDANDHFVTLSISDEGPGIPKQYQQRIFERFYRIEKHRGGAAGGTGLGLAICRNIIQNHGGKIWVQSPNANGKEGATFYFTLARGRTSLNDMIDDAQDVVAA